MPTYKIKKEEVELQADFETKSTQLKLTPKDRLPEPSPNVIGITIKPFINIKLLKKYLFLKTFKPFQQDFHPTIITIINFAVEQIERVFIMNFRNRSSPISKKFLLFHSKFVCQSGKKDV